MIKIQKKDFDLEVELNHIKNKHTNVGAVSTFIGYVRDLNNDKDVKYIDLEVYNEMAVKELSKIRDIALIKWSLIDCIIIHRYGKLEVSDKIVLVACFSEHRNNSFEGCKFIMNYLKKDAPFWKKEYYTEGSNWLENTN
mgnify:CR=1 FL=1|tara:strand:+ start:295 stop:711 length:417 start_codon:yes stop_codon:yes gene_type:complete